MLRGKRVQGEDSLQRERLCLLKESAEGTYQEAAGLNVWGRFTERDVVGFYGRVNCSDRELTVNLAYRDRELNVLYPSELLGNVNRSAKNPNLRSRNAFSWPHRANFACLLN